MEVSICVGVNGGGAYVALYLLFLVIIGMPLMLAAITLGRKTQLSVFGAYKSIDKRWSFVGIGGDLRFCNIGLLFCSRRMGSLLF